MKDLPPFDVMVNMSYDQLQILQEEMSAQIINSAPPRFKLRLEGIQFKIDAEKRRHLNPMARCIALNRLMQESIVGLNNVLQGNLPVNVDLSKSATILPFTR